MRKLLLTIHAYLGLFCLPYLLIFGITSLDFNHHFLDKETRVLKNTWTENVNITPGLKGEDLGNALRDSLGFFGWYVPWDSYSDSSTHHIKITHFGKDFEMDLSRNDPTVTINEYNLSSGKVLFGLHALGESVPAAPAVINSWQYYQDLTVYASLFWIITGIYLWFVRKRKSKVSTWALILVSAFSITLITYLWLVG